MTSEQVRLEIQIEVRKALADLKSATAEYQKLAEAAKKVVPPTDQIKATMASLSGEMKVVAASTDLFGTKTDGLRAQQNLLRSAVVDMLRQGLQPQSTEIQKLKGEYDALGTELSQMAAKELAATEATRAAAAAEESAAQKTAARRAAMNSIGNAMSIGVTLPILAAGTAAVKFASDLEQSQIAFGVLLRDMDKGKDLFNQIKGFANVTPFETSQLTGPVQTLLSFGVAGKDVMGVLKELGDVSMGNADKLQNLAVVFGQVSSAGRLQGQDLMQLINAGFNPLQVISEKTGLSMGKLRDMMERGAISSDMVKDAFRSATSEGGQFAGMMDRMGQSTSGKLSTMMDALRTDAAQLGTTLLPTVKMVVDEITKIAGAFTNLDPTTQKFILQMLAVAAATGPVIKGIVGIQGAIKALSISSPIMLAITGGVALITGVIALLDQANAQAEALKKHAQDAMNISKGADQADIDRLRALSVADATAKVQEKLSYLTGAKTFLTKELDDMQAKLAAFYKKQDEDAQKGIMPQSAKFANDLLSKIEADKQAIQQTVASQAAYSAFITELSKKKDTTSGSGSTSFGGLPAETTAATKALQDYEVEVKKNLLLWQNGLTQTSDFYANARGTEQGFVEQLVQLMAATTDPAQYEALDSMLQSHLELLNTFPVKFDGVSVQAATIADLSGTAADHYAQMANILGVTTDQLKEIQALQDKYNLSIGNAVDKWKAIQALQKYAPEAANSQAGQLFTGQGAAAGDPGTMAIQALTKMITSITNVSKVLNFLDTIFEGMKEVIEPFVNEALQPIVDALSMLGEIIGQALIPIFQLLESILSPIGTLLMTLFSAIGPLLKLFTSIVSILVQMNPVFVILNAAFSLLAEGIKVIYNYVIRPVANFVIGIFNAIISVVNFLLGWAGVHIKKIPTLDAIGDTTKTNADKIKDKQDQVSKWTDTINDYYQSLLAATKDFYEKQADSYKDLLQVGAISESAYKAKIDQINATETEKTQEIQSEWDKVKDSLQSISDQLSNGIDVKISGWQDFVNSLAKSNAPSIPSTSWSSSSVAGFAPPSSPSAPTGGAPTKSTSIFGFDVGTDNIPADQVAVVHQREMIVPRTFADGIRAGTVALSRPGNSGPTVTQIIVNVAGSVKAEDDLVQAITRGMAKQKKRGHAPAGT